MPASPLISVNKYIHKLFHMLLIKHIFHILHMFIQFIQFIKEFSLFWFKVDLNQDLILRSPLKLISKFTYRSYTMVNELEKFVLTSQHIETLYVVLRYTISNNRGRLQVI